MTGSWLDLVILFCLVLGLGVGVAQGAVATTLGFLAVGFGGVALIVAAPGLADLLVEIGVGPVGARIGSMAITFTLSAGVLIMLGQAARSLLKDTLLVGWLDKVLGAVVGVIAGLVGASWLVQFLSLVRLDKKAVDGSFLAPLLGSWLSFVIDILRARGLWV